MNYKHTILMAAVALMAAVGCNKVQNDPVTGDGGDYRTNKLSFEVSQEGNKGFLEWNNPQGVKWVKNDTLVVFDDALNGVKFQPVTISDDKMSATFATNFWTGNVPTYAACYAHEAGEEYSMTMPEEGKIRVNQRWNQNFVQYQGCSSVLASCLVGKAVEDTPMYKMGEMKNVNGFIRVRLASSSISKVRVTSVGGEELAGWVDVDYEKLVAGVSDFYTVVTGKNMVQIVPDASTGKAHTEDGNFVGNSYNDTKKVVEERGYYCIAVLPGTYEQGLQIDLYAGNEVICTRTIGGTNGVVVHRNEVVNVTPCLDLPDTVSLDIYFGNEEGVNPLGTFAATTDQKSNGTGENYSFTCNYTLGGHECVAVFPIKVGHGWTTTNYYKYIKYTTNIYGTGYVAEINSTASDGGKNGFFEFPAIPGKYFESVRVCTGNSVSEAVRIMDAGAATTFGTLNVLKGDGTKPNERTLHFYTNGNDGQGTTTTTTEKNVAYRLYNNAKAVRFNRIVVRYTPTLSAK